MKSKLKKKNKILKGVMKELKNLEYIFKPYVNNLLVERLTLSLFFEKIAKFQK